MYDSYNQEKFLPASNFVILEADLTTTFLNPPSKGRPNGYASSNHFYPSWHSNLIAPLKSYADNPRITYSLIVPCEHLQTLEGRARGTDLDLRSSMIFIKRELFVYDYPFLYGFKKVAKRNCLEYFVSNLKFIVLSTTIKYVIHDY